MVSVAFQLAGNREYFYPGEEVKGDILLTTSSAKSIGNVTIGIEGELEWLQKREHRDLNHNDIKSSEPTKVIGLDLDKYFNHSDTKSSELTKVNHDDTKSSEPTKVNHDDTKSSEPTRVIGLDLTNFFTHKDSGASSSKKGQSELVIDEKPTSGVPQGRSSQEGSINAKLNGTRPYNPTVDWSSSGENTERSILLRTEQISIIDSARTITPGVHKFPFSITLPLQAEGAPLLSSFGTKDSRVKMVYRLVAKIPTHFFFGIPITRSYTHPFNVIQRTTASQLRDASEKYVTAAIVKVGHWVQESRQVSKMISYLFGADTAQSWTKLRVEAEFPSLVSVHDEPYYLQKSLKIVVKPLEECAVPIFVEHVKTSVRTRVVINGTLSETETWQFKNSGDWQVLVDGETDATSLISGAKLDGTILPTIDHYSLHVSHYLLIELKLRSADMDGTRQDATKVKLIIPLRVSDSALDQDTSEFSLI